MFSVSFVCLSVCVCVCLGVSVSVSLHVCISVYIRVFVSVCVCMSRHEACQSMMRGMGESSSWLARRGQLSTSLCRAAGVAPAPGLQSTLQLFINTSNKYKYKIKYKYRKQIQLQKCLLGEFLASC